MDSWSRQGDEHPTYAVMWSMARLPFILQLRQYTHTRLTALFPGRYQKGKTNLDFTEAGDSEWQCHQLGHMHLASDR